MNKTIIIGLDGVSYDLLGDLACKGVMTNTKKLIDEGIFKKMQSSLPEVSSVAWSSIITGKNPAEHGIFGFTELAPHSYRLTFPNFSNLKAKAFWQTDIARRHIIINVPSTYPAQALNGVLVSGFVSPDMARAVYPDQLLTYLKTIDYRIDVDTSKGHASLELFLKDLNRINEARIQAYRHLWEQDWDVFMLVFTGADRLMHFLWDAYEDQKHKFHQEFLSYFRRVDEIIGEIISKMDDSDDLMVLSDHGFEKLDATVNLNFVLKENGFLKLNGNGKVNYNDIADGTNAFALDPARVYLNTKERFPKGNIFVKEGEKIIQEIEQLMANFEIDNKRIVKKIYRKEEIYEGTYLELAPDLVLIGNSGVAFKAGLGANSITTKDIFTGKHTFDDAFLLVRGQCETGMIPAHPTVSDVVHVMKRLQGGFE